MTITQAALRAFLCLLVVLAAAEIAHRHSLPRTNNGRIELPVADGRS